MATPGGAAEERTSLSAHLTPPRDPTFSKYILRTACSGLSLLPLLHHHRPPPLAASIQSEWAGGPPQSPNPRLYPPLLAYKTGPDRAGKSWSSESLRVAAEHPPSSVLSLPLHHPLTVF